MKIDAGTRIGKYEIRALVGEGGMGKVYRALDTELNRPAALKLLPPEFSSDERRMGRFAREARAASALNHPNIITIYEVGESLESRFIVAEYVEGETLRDRLNRAAVDLPAAIGVAAQIASALVAAHKAGIIHRDIKPENVMIRADGLVKVLDFGLAKLVERPPLGGEAETLPQVQTQDGMIMGTAYYMSPEQARGLAVDERTDVFSLGVVLYEMLTGQKPFKGETFSHTIVAILEAEPPPLSEYAEGYPAEVERILRKALRKERGGRYASAAEMLADLRALEKRLEFEAFSAREFGYVPSGGARRADTTPVEAQTIIFTSDADAARTQNSIAVLPFANLSADPENEYFCDGLAEEILNALAKIEELKVAARTSSFAFKNRSVSVGEIAHILRVNSILEGSVRRSGDRLRIMVQLINAADGYHLWSEKYDRQMRDIFDVQDEITLAVVDALKLKLLKKPEAVKRYTDNTEAYEFFLRGRYHFNKLTVEGRRQAIEYFQKAIEAEPDYAPAYAGIALCLGISVYFGFLSPRETMPRWKAMTARALEIDEGLVEAHLSQANSLFFHEWDWAEAGRAYRRALELNPNFADAHSWYGVYLAVQGSLEQALKEGRRALELDPLSLLANIFVGWIYLFTKRPEDALTRAQKMLEIEPRYHATYWLKGSIHLAGGQLEEALEAYRKGWALGGTPLTLSYLGCVYGLLGRHDEARDALRRMLEVRSRGYAAAMHIARVYAGLGETEQAFEWLDKAFEERNGEMVFLNLLINTGTGNLLGKISRDDPRFQSLTRRVGLPQSSS